jgi:hypothetical protein
MKQANHNSMDLLLRSLARGQEELRTGGEPVSAPVSEHLDADELNLYAEGVLAPPARARYTEHLADCQHCRKLVTGLAQAAGRTVTLATKSQQSGAGFWQSIATLISLPVMRYALPAVLLTGMLAIGLVLLREQKRPELVAVNQQAEPNPVFDQQGGSSGNAATTASPPTVSQPQPTEANSSSNAPIDQPVGNPGILQQKPGSTTETKVGDSMAAKEAPQVTGVATSQPSYAPEPAPPPKVVSEAVAKTEARKEEVMEREAAKRNQDEVARISKDDSPTHGPTRSRTMGAGRRDADLAAANRGPSKDKKAGAEETETLTVSGRRFRRQGNAWVDTAYQESGGATNVGRGSEQFRALMADEPGLRAIVQQLGGEVIVVWKNRAYRIR